jgi:hypothetical protein
MEAEVTVVEAMVVVLMVEAVVVVVRVMEAVVVVARVMEAIVVVVMAEVMDAETMEVIYNRFATRVKVL